MRKGTISNRSNPFSPQGDSLNSAGQGPHIGLGGVPPRSEFVLGRPPAIVPPGREPAQATEETDSNSKSEEQPSEKETAEGDESKWDTSDAEMEDASSTSAAPAKEPIKEEAKTAKATDKEPNNKPKAPVPQTKPKKPPYPNHQEEKPKALSSPQLPIPVVSQAASLPPRVEEPQKLPPPMPEPVPPVVLHRAPPPFNRKPPPQRRIKTLFSQIGFGVDHESGPTQDATQAAIRAVRDAMIRGAVMPIRGKREDIQIKVKLGVPPKEQRGAMSPLLQPMNVNLTAVAQSLPHGLVMPIQVVLGGLAMSDVSSMHEAIRSPGSMCCVVACISTGILEVNSDGIYGDIADENGMKLKIRALEGANETLFREKQEIENEKIVLYKQLTIQEDALKQIARSRGEDVRDLMRPRTLSMETPLPQEAASAASLNDHHLAAGALVGIAGSAGPNKKHKPNPVCAQGQATAIELLSNRLSLPNGIRSSPRLKHATALNHLKGGVEVEPSHAVLEHPELRQQNPQRSDLPPPRASLADDDPTFKNEPPQRRASAPIMGNNNYITSSSTSTTHARMDSESSSSTAYPQANSYTGEMINAINQDRMILRSGSAHDSIASASGDKKTAIRRSSPGLTAKNNKRQFVQHDYHDYMNETPTPEEEERCRNKLTSGSSFNDYFPVKLHNALDEIIRDGYSDIVSWQPHGRCFLVHKVQDFKDKILSQYFVLTKYSSFLRQLNLYGFCRLSTGPDKGAYYHELFLRGMPFLAHRMIRTRVNGHGIRPADNPETEPDFYKLPPIPLMAPSEPMRLDSATYTDRSMELPTEPVEEQPSSEKNRAGISFPQKLHSVLDMIEQDNRADIISWQPHGRSIMVHKPDLFVKIVMPTYFRQTKITSFQRQLNMYGFQRISTGLDKGAYYHEFFLRGLPHLCARMVRTRVNGKGVRKPSNPDSEPNFYVMRPLQPSEDSTTVSSADTNTAVNEDD